jgi:hypothetical protein
LSQDITTLLTLTGTALNALRERPSGSTEADAEHQVAAFKSAMDKFLSTLHSVDVRIKRQIMGLEEAGVVSLKDSKGATSLEPNGVGQIGDLDVGWLNSRSDKVERDMEIELWRTAREQLEELTGKGAKTGGEDVTMGDP